MYVTFLCLFGILRQGLFITYPRLALNLKSSCLTPLKCWDYRCPHTQPERYFNNENYIKNNEFTLSGSTHTYI